MLFSSTFWLWFFELNSLELPVVKVKGCSLIDKFSDHSLFCRVENRPKSTIRFSTSIYFVLPFRGRFAPIT